MNNDDENDFLSKEDGEKYEGMYVATPDFGNKTVVGSGETPSDAYEDAVKNGHEDPFTFYVFKKGTHFLYQIRKAD